MKTHFRRIQNLVYYPFLMIILLCVSCSKKAVDVKNNAISTVDDTTDQYLIEKSLAHKNPRMHYKVLTSRYSNRDSMWANVRLQLEGFSEKDYDTLFDKIYNQNIPQIQQHVSNGSLSYELLTKWYLYRILKYEGKRESTLHSILSIIPNALSEAKKRDLNKGVQKHPIYGMPILLKDNINAEGTPTTAGAIALANNLTSDATIVKNLKQNGAIILGKVNLSEWAYYFCDGCPLGYSAVGGQTLNPYGRMVFETGGSSAASGTSMAANYAAGAVGTETAGSILSPSSQNSIVGLKPTIGVLSRSGIVPISSTLDTPGPMTRSVVDNAIVLSAMYGEDSNDKTTIGLDRIDNFYEVANSLSDNPITLAANTTYLETDVLYKETVDKLRAKGAIIKEFSPADIDINGFVSILDYDMQRDLPIYLTKNANPSIPVKSVSDVISYNNQDSTLRAPYGQGRFIASRDDKTTDADMNEIKSRLQKNTRQFFDSILEGMKVDAILSINNYDAAYTAVAKYPCLAMPMGYMPSGEPKAITLIGRRYDEAGLLRVGAFIETNVFQRVPPKGY